MSSYDHLTKEQLIALLQRREHEASYGLVWERVEIEPDKHINDDFVANCIWQKRYSRENRETIGDAHEYILVYAANTERFKRKRRTSSCFEKKLTNCLKMDVLKLHE